MKYAIAAIAALAYAATIPPSQGEWRTEVMLNQDEWDKWSDRMILRFRLEEWEKPTPVPKPITVPNGPCVDA